VQTAISGITGIDEVTVERTGDGSVTSTSLYGYVYTVYFWGEYTTTAVAQLTIPTANLGAGSCAAFVGGAAHTVLVATLRAGIADGSINHVYTSLAENTAYTVRVSAKNAMGYGAGVVAVASTANFGVIPGVPSSVALLAPRRADEIQVSWKAPIQDGGADVTQYKVEWDTKTTFDSAQYAYNVVQQIDEVQKVTVDFDSTASRGGTFQLGWGGKKSAALAWNTPAATMAAALCRGKRRLVKKTNSSDRCIRVVI
jgi:hypothetical protein